MSLPRRFFLKSCSYAAVGAVFFAKTGITIAQKFLGAEYYQVPLNAQGDFLYMTSYETFQSYIGSIFTTPGARGEEVQLILVSVTPYVPKASTRLTTGRTSKTESFSLSFRGSGKLSSTSVIPTLSHPALGNLAMFVSSKGETTTGCFYEAVINHIK